MRAYSMEVTADSSFVNFESSVMSVFLSLFKRYPTMLPRRIGFFNAIRAFWLGRMFNGARLRSRLLRQLHRDCRTPAQRAVAGRPQRTSRSGAVQAGARRGEGHP